MEAQSAPSSRCSMPLTPHALPSSPISPPRTPDLTHNREADPYCFLQDAYSFNKLPRYVIKTESRKAQTDWIIPVDTKLDLTYNLETYSGRVSLSGTHQASKISRDSNSTYTLPPSPVDQYEDSVRDNRPKSPLRQYSSDERTLNHNEYTPLSPARSPATRRLDSFINTPIVGRSVSSPPSYNNSVYGGRVTSPIADLVIDETQGHNTTSTHTNNTTVQGRHTSNQSPRPVLPPTPPDHQFLRPERPPQHRPKDGYSMRNRATIEHYPKFRYSQVNAEDLRVNKSKYNLYRYRAPDDRMGANSTSLENIDSDTLRASDIFNSTTITALEQALEVGSASRTSTPNGTAVSNASTGSGKKTPSPSTSYLKSEFADSNAKFNSCGETVDLLLTNDKAAPMSNSTVEPQLNHYPSPDTPGHPLGSYKDQMPMPGQQFPLFPSFGGPVPRYSPMLTVLNHRDALPGMDGRMDAQQAKALEELTMNQMKLFANMGIPTSRPDDMSAALKYSSVNDPLYYSQPSPSGRSERSQSRYSDIGSECPKLNNRDYNVNIIDGGHSSPVSPDGREFPNSPQMDRPGYSQADGNDDNKYLPGYSPLSVSQTIADSLRLCTGNGKTERLDGGSPCLYGMEQRQHSPYVPSSSELLHCSEIKKEYDAGSECSYGGNGGQGDKAAMDMYHMMAMPARINPGDGFNRKRTSSSFGSDSDSSGVRSPKPTKYRKAIENIQCSVCGDSASGFHCGAYVCEACKKFFIRSSKNESTKFVCSKQKQCDVTKESRTQCQYCRYKKCIDIGMFKPGSNPLNNVNANMANFPCRVCGAPSSGYHFGAITCEGCKGFFRRTIKERDSHRYVCPKRGQCTVTMVTRNFCKFCRYQKCLSVGMTPEGSRIGRQPNSVKHQTLMELQQIVTSSPTGGGGLTNSSPSSSEPATPKPKDVASPYLLRRQQTGFTREDMEVVISSLMSSFSHLKLLQKKPDGMGDIHDTEQLVVWDFMMKQFNFDAHNVLKFAKKIPGFKSLPVDDQVILLQNSMYQTCMFMHVDQYDVTSDKINYFNFSEVDRQSIMGLFPSFKVFENHYHYFGQTFHPLRLDEKETACMVALQIVSPLDSGMKTWKEIAQLQETISISLQMYIEEKEGPDSDRFGVLLLQLPALNSAGIKHQQVITALRNDKPHLPFPQLFRELFLSYDEHEAKLSVDEKALIDKGIALCEKMTHEGQNFQSF